jgi:hypothetical protein
MSSSSSRGERGGRDIVGLASSLLLSSHGSSSCMGGDVGERGCVGTLPQGYVRNVPLPRIPLQQSTSSNQIHTIPDYYEVSHGVPPYDTTRSIVENAAYAFSPAWHAIAINT